MKIAKPPPRYPRERAIANPMRGSAVTMCDCAARAQRSHGEAPLEAPLLLLSVSSLPATTHLSFLLVTTHLFDLRAAVRPYRGSCLKRQSAPRVHRPSFQSVQLGGPSFWSSSCGCCSPTSCR